MKRFDFSEAWYALEDKVIDILVRLHLLERVAIVDARKQR